MGSGSDENESSSGGDHAVAIARPMDPPWLQHGEPIGSKPHGLRERRLKVGFPLIVIAREDRG